MSTPDIWQVHSSYKSIKRFSIRAHILLMLSQSPEIDNDIKSYIVEQMCTNLSWSDPLHKMADSHLIHITRTQHDSYRIDWIINKSIVVKALQHHMAGTPPRMAVQMAFCQTDM